VTAPNLQKGCLAIMLAIFLTGCGQTAVPANAQACLLSQKGDYAAVQGPDAGQDCNALSKASSGGWTLATGEPPSEVQNWTSSCVYDTRRGDIAQVFFQTTGPEGASASGICGDMGALGWSEH
jgi:hypothetical protein